MASTRAHTTGATDSATTGEEAVDSDGFGATRPLHADEIPSLPEGVEPGPGASGSMLRAGQRVGRYVVLEDLARGGMSIVFVAYDPELDRRVALKVVRPDGSEQADKAQARLLREAQAMARLAHPNVVRVYDVGVLGDRIYMAMELVEGEDLRDWLSPHTRPWREIVDVLVRAGRGLAAAHDVGMVHLDVKPRNILVGTDGEVRVVDFGLARGPRSPDSVALDDIDDGSSSSGSMPSAVVSWQDGVTLAGTVMGTPGYMAPEQLLGETPDARSDQFAFCVTAWEALYGARPFDGTRIEPYRTAVLRGTVREPPASAKVPLRLRRLLERGLSVEPQQRFASMSELLDAMIHDPWRRWRRNGMAALAIGGAVLGAWVLGRGGEDPCAGIGAQLDGVWDDARRGAARTQLMALGGEHAADAADEIGRMLDGYAQRWVDQATDACQAARVEGRQSAALMDLRDYCLQHRLRALRATTDLMIESEPSPTSQWREAVIGLPLVERCTDVTSVHQVGQPPEDPETRRTVDAIADEIARARALIWAGHNEDAVAVAEPLIARAEATGHQPTIAEAKIVLAQVYLQVEEVAGAERYGYEGVWAADAAQMHALRLDAYVDLMFVVGVMRGRFEEAEHMGRGALILEKAQVDSPTVRAQLLSNLGAVYATAGRTEDAMEHFTRAMEIRRAESLPEDLNEGTTLVGMGAAELLLGDYQAALEWFERSRSMMRRLYGKSHPATLVSQENLAIALHGLDRFEEARDEVAEVIALAHAQSRDERSLASVRASLGAILLDLGQLDEAHAQLERARETMEAPAVRPVLLGIVYGNLAEAALLQGRPADALQRLDQARGLLSPLIDEEHIYFAWLRSMQARAEIELDRPLDALEHAGQAMQLLEDVVDPRKPDMRSDAALVIAKALDEPAVQADADAVARWGRGRTPLAWQAIAKQEAQAGGRSAQTSLARAQAWTPRHAAADGGRTPVEGASEAIGFAPTSKGR